MEKTDKAVSTEDLCIESQSAMCLEAAKLEALFKTLVENKVEAIKNDKVKSSSVHSSPKSLVHRLRVTSSSSANSSKETHHLHNSPNRKHRRRKKAYDDDDDDDFPRDIKVAKRSVSSKAQAPSISPESARYKLQRSWDRKFCAAEKPQDTFQFLHCDSICSTDDFITSTSNNYPCCCPNDRNGQINMHYNDYVSLKIEDFEDEEEAMMNREALRRARRKRRKRRKRRMKNHRIEITALPVPEIVKELDPDELPQRARWTIVATACLLLFMCLLLVGVTLRMAPIIDDMVRKENEELMNSLHRSPAIGHHNPFNSSASHIRKEN